MPKAESEVVRRAELVEKVASSTKQSKKLVDEVVGATLDAITGTLRKGGKVQFTGFGTFEVKNRAARVGTNPQTKQKLRIPATKVPAFKPGALLKQAVSRKRK